MTPPRPVPLLAAEALTYEFIVAEGEAGLRLDHYLAARQLRHSRSQVKRHVDAGCCQVNALAARPAKRLRSGDRVRYCPPPPEPDDVIPEAIELAVLFEDEQLVVVDKAAGMVVHPAAGHRTGTLVAALLAHCTQLSGIGDRLRPGIVHRLDRLTSGVMVVAKNDAAHRELARQFAVHSIERRYLALVCGAPPAAAGCFDTWYGRHPTERKRFSSRVAAGRRAVTHYRLLAALQGAALVEARLETGRTHQVRVHFADAQHPVLGDPQYGRAPADPLLRRVARELGRQALHAHVLGFVHPGSGQWLRFVSPPPPDLQRALAALGAGNRPATEGAP